MKKLQDKSYNWITEIHNAEQKPYKYQPPLTKKLDSYSGEFNETTLLEIVLWKTNRQYFP